MGEREKKNRCTRKAWFKMSMEFIFESGNSKPTYIKMTGGTPEVGSDKSLTLLTFDIGH